MLISDPCLREMNATQWIFELENLNVQEKERYEELTAFAKLAKQGVISLFGLNLMPMEDHETGLLRRPNENEFIPLMIAVGRPEIIQEVVKRNEELIAQEQVQQEMEEEGVDHEIRPVDPPMEPEELEQFMRDDLEFLDDPSELEKALVWNSPSSKYIRENVVLDMDSDSPLSAAHITPSVKITTDEVSAAPRGSAGRIKIDMEE